jgi:(S)-ureidoglycine aminohydrolase
MTVFGDTRTRVGLRHALIAPDGLVPSVLPGITGAVVNVIISPAMGAKLTQLLLTFEAGGRAEFAEPGVESCLYVMSGKCTARVGGKSQVLAEGGYVFAPADEPLVIDRPRKGTRVTAFQKRFVPLAGVAAPAPVFGNAAEVPGQPFLGDPDARLQTLLPDDPAFDLAVNLFTYQPGARLPFVETHVMEHGLIMLAGEGVYRLEDAWYPVTAGDAIWMAPYCPQWFVAMGKQPASYLYYKDVNRSSQP